MEETAMQKRREDGIKPEKLVVGIDEPNETMRMIKVGNTKEVPIWEKSNLTIEEAAAYSGIGRNKLRELTENENCQFVLWIGTKRLVKRKKLDEYIEKAYSI